MLLQRSPASPSWPLARHQSVMGPCACSTSGSTISSSVRRPRACRPGSAPAAAQLAAQQGPAHAPGRLLVTTAAQRAAEPPLSQSDASQQPDRILQALQQQRQEQQQRGRQQQQQQQQEPDRTQSGEQPVDDLGPWTYKYQRLRCSSPCARSDRRCHEVEALFQHVLSYERLPPKVARWLCTIDTDLDAMTDLVENMAQHFGKELTLWFLRKNPAILGCDFATVLARCTAAQKLVGLRLAELPMLLRKNPMLMSMDAEVTRGRYEAIPRCMDFRAEQVRQLVTKCPLVLNYNTPALRGMVESLRQLAYTRDEWQADFEALSPSLLAYYIRDHNDLLRRLEYLVATGESSACSLRDVFKPSNNLFAGRHRGFRKWADLMKRRRGELGGR